VPIQQTHAQAGTSGTFERHVPARCCGTFVQDTTIYHRQGAWCVCVPGND